MSKRKSKLTSIWLAIMMLCACGSEDPTESPQTGSITGYVYDAGTALPIASVNVTSEPPTSAVTTDTTGYYTILNIEPEVYNLSATKMGYTLGRTNISVTAGNATIADIFLVTDTTGIGLE